MIKKFITLFALLLISISFLGCKKTTQTSTSTPKLAILNNDIGANDQKIKENLVRAKVAAESWQKNAQFIAVVLKVNPEMQVNTLTETFVFGSSSTPNDWWTFSISENNGKIVRSLTPKEDFLGTEFQPINEPNWKTSYVEALNAAEDSGGLAFRSKNPNTNINISLVQTSPKNWLWWKIDYLADSESLKMNINVLDGKVSDDQGNPFEASMPNPTSSASINPTPEASE